jgi:UDP-glucuronate 4-epimerase
VVKNFPAVLVTGGAGFIGSHLVDRLLVDGCRVFVVDELNDFYSPGVKEANIHKHRDNNNFFFFKTDIRDFNALEEIFKDKQIDLVVHLAARAGIRPSLIDPRLYQEVNVGGSVNLLELTKKYGIKKFIFASSSSVYGLNSRVPFNEEENIARPISPYAATKIAGEALCHVYSHLYDINTVCLRFFTAYGPRQRPDLAIHKFSRLILEGKPIPFYGDGKTSRDYTYIDDIIQGILSAIDYNGEKFDIFNLGNSYTVTLSDLIELLERLLGRKAIIERLPEQPGDMKITRADISKASKLLNYFPQTGIEQGLKKFAEWLLLNN